MLDFEKKMTAKKTIKPQSLIAIFLIINIIITIFASLYLYYWITYVKEDEKVVWTKPNTTTTAASTTTFITPPKRISTKYPTTTTTTTPKPPSVPPTELEALIVRMIDTDRQTSINLTINWQNATDRKKPEDNAPEPMFDTKIDMLELRKRPTYDAYMNLITKNYFNPDDDISEKNLHNTNGFISDKKSFLAAIQKTTVFGMVLDFACRYKRLSCDKTKAMQQVGQMWFGQYNRGKGDTLSSSGFEHVFVGEWRGSKVSGQHYWLMNYLMEQDGAFNYNGYVDRIDDLIGTVQYEWIDKTTKKQYIKKIGGFLIGTNPEFDFALFTICFLIKRGGECPFEYDGYKYAVMSYEQRGTHFIATSFPTIK